MEILKKRSRKLDLCVFSMLLMAGGFLLCGRFPTLQANFPAFIGGVNAIYALYVGGNSAAKYIYNKKAKETSNS